MKVRNLKWLFVITMMFIMALGTIVNAEQIMMPNEKCRNCGLTGGVYFDTYDSRYYCGYCKQSISLSAGETNPTSCNHDYKWTDVYGTHKHVCTICGSVGDYHSPSWEYLSKDATYHTKSCKRCNISVTEKHTLKSDGACQYCTYKNTSETGNASNSTEGTTSSSGYHVEFEPSTLNLGYNSTGIAKIYLKAANGTASSKIDTYSSSGSMGPYDYKCSKGASNNYVTVTVTSKNQDANSNLNLSVWSTEENEAFSGSLKIVISGSTQNEGVNTNTSTTCTHTAGTTWEWANPNGDRDKHWHKCTKCGEYIESTGQAHSFAWRSFGNSNTHYYACTVCGYTTQVPAEYHTANWDYVDLGNGTHQAKCTRCTIVNSSPAAHVDGDNNGWCDYCGHQMPTQSGGQEGNQNGTQGDGQEGNQNGTQGGEQGGQNTPQTCQHEYQEQIIKDSTCTEIGKKVNTCSKCGDSYEEGIAVKPHKPSTWQTNATQHWTICINCGTEIAGSRGNHVDANSDNKCDTCEYDMTCNHTWDNGTITKQPTCKETGIKTFTCTKCGTTRTEPISQLNHTEGSEWQKNDTIHWKVCTLCGTEINKSVHTFDSNNVCTVCGYVLPTTNGDEFIEEPWMIKSKDLRVLAVQLRCESSNDNKMNKNIYALNEEITYYIDYRNGSSRKIDSSKIVFELPLNFTIVDKGAGTVSGKTITWTFKDGIEPGVYGTKVVKLKYTSLGSSRATYKMIYPVVDIYNGSKVVDSSSVMNLIFKDVDTEIVDESHYPYMYGDKDKPTFRPDDGISRAEGALVLTRIFGINTTGIRPDNQYFDLNETYEEAQKAIVAATEVGLINGMGDGSYRPNAKMTRAQFMKIVAANIELIAKRDNLRGFEIKDSINSVKIYRDSARVNQTNYAAIEEHWANPYVTLLARLNMTDLTYKNKDIRMDENITRAEVTQLVNLYLFRAPAEINSKTVSKFEDVTKKHKLFADIIEATRDVHTYKLTLDGTELVED